MTPPTPRAIAALVIAAATTLAGCVGLAPPAAGGEDAARPFAFHGIPLLDGGARAGLPAVPLNVSAQGHLVGNTTYMAGVLPGVSPQYNVLDWFRYCGREASPALDAGHTDDNALYYHDLLVTVNDEEPWYAERVGEPIRPEDIPEGRSVYASWRSQGLEGEDAVVLIVARLNASHLHPSALGFTHDGVMAFSALDPGRCSAAELAGEHSPHATSIANRTGHPGNASRLVVNLDRVSVWDPHRVVGDLLVTGATAPLIEAARVEAAP